MPSNLALSLCLLFCFVVLYGDNKLQKDVAWSAWLPTLWMMRCASRGLSLWFNPEFVDADLEGSIHDQIFFGMLMLVGCVVLWQRRDRIPAILKSNVFLFIFFGYMGLSVFWSEDPTSFKRWIKAIGNLIMVLVVVTEAQPLQAALSAFRRTSYLLVPLSVTLIRYFHDLGTMPSRDWAPDMWIGVATHKNTLAQICLFAGVVLFLDAVRTWRDKRQVLRLPFLKLRVDVLYGAMLVYLLHGGGHSKSTTSFLALVVACSLFLLLEYRHRRGRQIMPMRFVFGLLCVGLVVHVGIELAFDSSLYEAVAESQGKDATLTGRTELWEDLLIMGQRHPLLGAGYGGFWTFANAAELKQRHFWGPHQAHNGYIEIWLQLGLVGLCLFALVVWQAIHGITLLFREDFEQGRFRLIVLLITLFHNYSEAGFPRPDHLVWFVFLLIVLNVKPVQTISAEEVSVPYQQTWQPYSRNIKTLRARQGLHARNLRTYIAKSQR